MISSGLISSQVKGLQSIAEASLKVLFDNYAANQSETNVYAITIGTLGGISRMDADFYSYQYTSADIQKITKNVVVISLVVSSVNVLSLTVNDLRTIVQTCYKDSTSEVRTAIYDLIHAEWKKEKKEAKEKEEAKAKKKAEKVKESGK